MTLGLLSVTPPWTFSINESSQLVQVGPAALPSAMHSAYRTASAGVMSV
jgi:hypothetical protein